MTLTSPDKEKVAIARYTQDEKTVIFNLLEKYEEIIDIKQRKNSRRKTMEVRECWQLIHDSYNSDPRITTKRNLKQLQKFWLNARLRKRFPNRPHQSSKQFRPKPKLITNTVSTLPQNFQSTASAPQFEMHIIHNQTSSNNEMLKQEAHEMSIETSSNDNLSLNDLLEFKNVSGGTAILEIRRNTSSNNEQHPNASSLTEAQEFIRNDENDKIEIERAVEGVYYENVLNSEDDQEVEIEPASDAILGEIPSQCEMTEEITEHRRTNRKSNPVQINQNFSDRLRSIRISEAEVRLKEQQMRYEKERIEFEKSREELRHMKEMHSLQLQEMRIKLKLLEKSGGVEGK